MNVFPLCRAGLLMFLGSLAHDGALSDGVRRLVERGGGTKGRRSQDAVTGAEGIGRDASKWLGMLEGPAVILWCLPVPCSAAW